MSTTAVILPHPPPAMSYSMTVLTMMYPQSMYTTPFMCSPTAAAHTPMATRTQSMITRTHCACTASTGTDAPTGVSMPTSSGIWRTGTSYFGIPHGTVHTISTGISIHHIIMIPGSTVVHTTHGTMIPGTMTPGTIPHGITILISTVRTTHTPMSALVPDVTGESCPV